MSEKTVTEGTENAEDTERTADPFHSVSSVLSVIPAASLYKEE